MSQNRRFQFGVLMTVLSFLLFCQFSFSQTPSRINSTNTVQIKGQMNRVMFSGLGGAVFGLSTLSFYNKPQNHMSHVAIGAATGLLIGLWFVFSDNYTDQYSYQGDYSIHEYDHEYLKKLKENSDSPLTINMRFSF